MNVLADAFRSLIQRSVPPMNILQEQQVCILHIGVHKTGSGSIQNTFHKSRQQLLEKYGIFFQEYDINLTSALRSIFQPNPERYHANIKVGANTPELAARQNDIHLQGIKKDLEKSSKFHIVLSAEGLSSFTTDEAKSFMKLLRNYYSNIKVIVYLLHPVSWVASIVQQRFSMGKPIPQTFRKKDLPNYKGKLVPWVNAVGNDKIYVRDFGDVRKLPLGVLSDFCGLLGVDENDLIAKTTNQANTGLLNTLHPYVEEEIKRIWNERVVNDADYFRSIRGRKFGLPLHVIEPNQGMIDEDLAWLKQEFGFQFSETGEIKYNEEAYDSETQESLALLISDLINHHHYMMRKILFDHSELLWLQKKPARAIGCLKAILKTSPYDTKARKKLKQYEMMRVVEHAETTPDKIQPGDETDASSKT